MMQKSNEVTALDTYYETANAEYDRIDAYFNQVDSKAGFLIAIVIGLPIATIGFASQLKSGEFNVLSLVLVAIGILAFLGAGWHILRALRTRDVRLGVQYDEFNRYCKEYEDKAMKEWVADILIKSSEFNYKEALKKAEYLKKVVPFLIAETIFLLSGITSILISKL